MKLLFFFFYFLELVCGVFIGGESVWEVEKEREDMLLRVKENKIPSLMQDFLQITIGIKEIFFN